jgi:hypothetical protein
VQPLTFHYIPLPFPATRRSRLVPYIYTAALQTYNTGVSLVYGDLVCISSGLCSRMLPTLTSAVAVKPTHTWFNLFPFPLGLIHTPHSRTCFSHTHAFYLIVLRTYTLHTHTHTNTHTLQAPCLFRSRGRRASVRGGRQSAVPFR